MRVLGLVGLLALAACGGGDAKSPPVKAQLRAEPARAQPTPAPEPIASRLDRPRVEVLEAGAEPRQRLHYQPTAGEGVITLTLASTLALDLGIAAVPPTQAPALRMRLDASTRTRSDDTFVLALTASKVEAVEGTGSAALAAGMGPTVAALEQLRAELVLTGAGALLETSLSIPPVPGTSGPSEGERLQNAFAQLFVPLPADPIGPGARWSVTRELGFAGARIEQTSTYTLSAHDGDRVVVELALEQRPAAGAGATTGPSTDSVRTHLDALHTTGTGRIELDLRRFGPVDAHSRSHSEVTQTIERDGQRQQVSMTLDLELDAQTASS